MTADIIPFPRGACDCRLCQTIRKVWPETPRGMCLDEFLAENVYLLRPYHPPCWALREIAQKGSSLARQVAATVLCEAKEEWLGGGDAA
jgi:hypothetical protein